MYSRQSQRRPSPYAQQAIQNFSPRQFQNLINTSWTTAIATVAGQSPYFLSATEAAVVLSPFWRLGKTQGLSDEELFDYAVRHVQTELPTLIQTRQRIRVPRGFDYSKSPRAFQENPMYQIPSPRRY